MDKWIKFAVRSFRSPQWIPVVLHTNDFVIGF